MNYRRLNATLTLSRTLVDASIRPISYPANRFNDIPWFMRETPDSTEKPGLVPRDSPQTENQTLPNDVPEHIATLHQYLSRSPLLAPSTLRVCKPNSLQSRTNTEDLALSYTRIKGRRKRGVRDAGETVGEPGDIWSWYVIAEVKAGTEGRGAIETVIKNAHRELLNSHPHLPLPQKLSRRRTTDGWEVLDLGDSLLHVCSRQTSQKLFGDQSQDLN